MQSLRVISYFSNNELNTDVGVVLQYNFLNLKRKIQYENQEYEKYYMTQRKINNEYEIKKIDIYQERQRNSLRIEIEKVSKKYPYWKVSLLRQLVYKRIVWV